MTAIGWILLAPFIIASWALVVAVVYFANLVLKSVGEERRRRNG